MSGVNVGAAEFRCDGCGERFRQQTPAPGGRPPRCLCGGVLRHLAEPLDDDALDEAPDYDLAPDPPRHGLVGAVPPVPAAAAAVRPPHTSKPAALAYRAPKDEVPAAGDPATITNLYMPLWLLGGGVAVQVVAALLRGGRHGVPTALALVGVELVVGTTLMLIGILIAARLRGIDLGRFWVAVYKLAAISVAPAAAVTLLSPALNVIPLGGLIGWAVAFVLYFALLGALFDLDQSDTWYCVCVIFLVSLVVYFALLWVLATRG